jgi:hypothetical protein
MMETKQEESKMDMQEMMAVYKKLSVPGATHNFLAKMEGTWDAKNKYSMESDQPAMESTGTVEQKMILGGRYLQQEHSSEMMGAPFTGINLIGYDNHTKKYVSTWIDTMSTGIYYFEGTASPDGKVITQECHYDDPVKGPTVWRSITRLVDEDTVVYEMYGVDKNGKEEKMGETTLTRRRPLH